MVDRKNINEATREDVAAIPFMNEERAEMIIHYREVNGPYTKESDLQKVTGINERLAARVAEYFEISDNQTSEGGSKEGEERAAEQSSSRRRSR